MPCPKQSDHVYAEQLDQELCLYDWKRQRLHVLNPTAALVWQQCDGQTSPAKIAARLEEQLNISNADELVWLSLDRLEKAHLLQTKVMPPDNRRYTRRDVLKVAGISLVLLPVVTSIMLPSLATAQTGGCFAGFAEFEDACIAAGGLTAFPINARIRSCTDCIAACENELDAAFFGGVALFRSNGCICCTA